MISSSIMVGNWKMQASNVANRTLLQALASQIEAAPATWHQQLQVVICPPFSYLAQVNALLVEYGLVESIQLGAQDVSGYAGGAFTGQISASMLRDVGCQYVIIGHSERRHGCHESNADIASKFRQAQAVGLIPILCVGETLAQRQAEQTYTVLAAQLDAIFADYQDGLLNKFIIAYEPVWAIGSGQSASPEMAQAVQAWIRQWVAVQSKPVAENLALLYGGSLKAHNAPGLLSMPDINGGLIGGAALDAEMFWAICQAAFNKVTN